MKGQRIEKINNLILFRDIVYDNFQRFGGVLDISVEMSLSGKSGKRHHSGWVLERAD
jgi:hypothetical protein